MNCRNTFLNNKKLLMKRKNQLEKQINALPDGTLYIYNTLRDDGSNYSRYYNIIKEQDDAGGLKTIRKYIPRNHLDIAERLEIKKILELELEELYRELRAIDLYLTNCSDETIIANKIAKMKKRPGEKELIESFYTNKRIDSEEALKWKASIRKDPPFKPEGLKFQSKANVLVRSKGEQILVGELYDYDIPFVYEPTLILPDGTKFVPDIIALSLRTGLAYIIEHFGMMDNPEYAARVAEKLHKYSLYGYIPYVNLIPTFESANSGVDELWFEQIIQYFLL